MEIFQFFIEKSNYEVRSLSISSNFLKTHFSLKFTKPIIHFFDNKIFFFFWYWNVLYCFTVNLVARPNEGGELALLYKETKMITQHSLHFTWRLKHQVKVQTLLQYILLFIFCCFHKLIVLKKCRGKGIKKVVKM